VRTIFLSHSSEDRAAAESVFSALRGWGYQSIFLDYDARSGIPGGADWKQELYAQLSRSAAVLPLYSSAFFESRWCFAEIVAAGLLGKPVIALRLDGASVPSDLTHEQFIEFEADASTGFGRLRRALEREDVTPSRDFVPDFTRPPYPGLNAFEESDAAVFFGRNDDIRGIVERVNYVRAFGGKRCFLLIAGPSGSGKSSVLRAGLLAGLRKQRDRWTVLSALRPREGQGPLKELERQLGYPCPSAAELLSHQSGGATLVIGVDQFEELLGETPPPDSDAFAKLLVGLDNPARAIVIATIRSDLLGAFQTHPILRALDCDLYALPLLPQSVFAELVQGPAGTYGLRFEPPALADRIAADAGTKEALPLLAFALREMYERAGTARVLRESDYLALGGIQGAVAKVAERRFAALRLSPEELAALRVAFHRLLRLDTNLRPAKIPARWSSLPEASRRGIDALVDSRLLIATEDDGQRTVEIAHESLFRVWPTLAGWLKEDQRFLLWRQDLDAQRARWERDNRDAGSLLRGRALAEAREWQATRVQELDSDQRDFIAKSANASRRSAITGIVLAVGLFASLVLGSLGMWYGYEKDQELKAQTRIANAENGSPANADKARILQERISRPSVPEDERNAVAPSPPAVAAAGTSAGRPNRAAKQWDPGQTLHIRFLDGSAAVRQRIANLAQQWTSYANIRFVFDDAQDAELRISIKDQGSWALLGTDAKDTGRTQPTINLGFFSVAASERERDRAVLHEFGHVLGLAHEFQMPDATIEWNRERVYETYAQQGWTRETVDLNFFTKYPPSMFPQKPFDPQSIMMFPIPKEMTLTGVEYEMTYDLSAGDKAYIARLYPR
jgi:hypothetical protein